MPETGNPEGPPDLLQRPKRPPTCDLCGAGDRDRTGMGSLDASPRRQKARVFQAVQTLEAQAAIG
jgi:hypothetical protein